MQNPSNSAINYCPREQPQDNEYDGIIHPIFLANHRQLLMFPPRMRTSTATVPSFSSAVKKKTSSSSDKVFVAVKVEKVISKAALAWALTHVVRPGDCITLLAVLSDDKTERRRFWGFPRLKGNFQAGESSKLQDRIGQISESCSQMVLQFHDQIDVRVHIKVVSTTSAGVVAAEAKEHAAKWVVLDKKLKQERKHCLEELRCNIVTMKGSQPKVLRLNLECSDETQTPFLSATSSPVLDKGTLQGQRMKHSTPISSPEEPSTSYTRTSEEYSLSGSDMGTPSFLVCQQNPLYENQNFWTHTPTHPNELSNPPTAPDFSEKIIILSTTSEMFNRTDERIIWIPQADNIDEKTGETEDCRRGLRNAYSLTRTKLDNLVRRNEHMMSEGPNHVQDFGKDLRYNSNIREAVSLGRTSSMPPPLCSKCQQKTPTFGKPPKQFDYQELEEATDGFSDQNFLAEGGFGLVHRGVLKDGLVVAVKQLKFAGSQADADFCREVRVLSCAQHRNVVLLIGFCIEQKKRLLVFEYICNGSLDYHLHGKTGTTLDWDLRLKIAIGTARGLRYLHEDCRVGRIIHRDMRPHNILLTHDFEPLVTDFGLARLHSEWEFGDEKRVVGTSVYLAPEYLNGAKVTEKVDVYAFGLVLLELITGQKPCNLPWHHGQHFSHENIFPLSGMEQIQLLDPWLDSCQLLNLPYELRAIGYAASLCLHKDPDLRPSMSKVLRLLEAGGGSVLPLELDVNSTGNRSGHMKGVNSSTTSQSRRKHSRKLSH